MAEIIDIRGRLRRTGGEETVREDGGTIYRVRLCGPDLHWVGAAGGILARAFVLEQFYTAFEDPETDIGAAAILDLRAGRELITECGSRAPGLIVTAAGIDLSPAVLRGAGHTTLLLVPEDKAPASFRSLPFPGEVVTLPIAAQIPEPLGEVAACAGGAARVLGAIRWTALEQALREELALFESGTVHRHLSMALDVFDRTARWAGKIAMVPEEIE